MLPILATNAFVDHIQYQLCPGAEKLLEFYNHSSEDIYYGPNQMVIPIDAHLVHRGDGVFETLSIMEYHILQLKEHIKRIVTSSKKLKLSLPCSTSKLKKLIMTVAKAVNKNEGNIRVLIGRGLGGFSISSLEYPNSSLYIVVYNTTQLLKSWYKNGLTACKSNILSNPILFLTNIKTVSYILGILMELEAIEQKVNLTLSFNEQWCFTKSAIANIAIVSQDNTLIFLEFQNILIETILEKTIEALKPSVLIELQCITEQELLTAKKILVLGTTHLCIGITKYNGHIIGNGTTGPISNMLRNMLKKTLLKHGIPINH